MAKRPVFIPLCHEENLVQEVQMDFKWNPGFAVVQKKKNIVALHFAAKKKNIEPLLEVSTKSEDIIGQRLSAFNLKLPTEIGEISLEAAFQGSKVFEKGGPYTDIYKKTSREAKKDERIRNSGNLLAFNFFGDEWPLEPKTAFYDWIYLTALKPYKDYLKRLFHFKGFTDIEFNPNKSFNCQAKTCALLVSLLKLNLFDEALSSKKQFIEIVSSKKIRVSSTIREERCSLI